MNPAPQVVTIGHAIVDVIHPSSDDFLIEQRLLKGAMELIEADRAVELWAAMMAGGADHLTVMSGGSAANTAVVVAALGGRSGFIGKVRDDELGHAFTSDLRAAGVRFESAMAPASAPVPTGRSLINVTPDAERTMCTFLGAARGLRAPDMAASLLETADVTYLEGYLWDELDARGALDTAMAMVHGAGKRFSLSLSDAFCVDRFRDEWIDLIDGHVDILFGNDLELCSLFSTPSLEHALERARGMCEISAITMGASGSLVLHGDQTIEVRAHHVDHVVDTTGAGDAYAGGFLFGLTGGFDLHRCGELGGIAAAEIISHLGARPSAALAEMARAAALH